MGCPARVPGLCRLHSEGQNLGSHGRARRPAEPLQSEEPGNPERIPARTQQRIKLQVKLRQSKTKRDTKVALRGQVPRGVSSDHVLSRAFGDALLVT